MFSVDSKNSKRATSHVRVHDSPGLDDRPDVIALKHESPIRQH